VHYVRTHQKDLRESFVLAFGGGEDCDKM